MSVDSKRDPLGISGTILAEKYRIGSAIGEGGFSVSLPGRGYHHLAAAGGHQVSFKVLANAPEDQRQELLGRLHPGRAS